jgi:hypothetical protein
MRPTSLTLALLAAPALMVAAPRGARAADATAPAPAPDTGLPRLGLDPGEPQVRSATPAIPFGVQPAQSKEFVLDFHGYFLLPARLGVHRREVAPGTTPVPGQGSLVLHAPPLVPQDLRSFAYTASLPAPWLQLNFVYGNETIAATAIIAGTSATDAAGYFNPVEQAGVSDAFLSLNLTKKLGFPLRAHVGAYTGRYGAMGAYDAGRYGTPLIFRTNTIGETITAAYRFGNFLVMAEQGLGGQIGRPPPGVVPGGWNDFAADVGATFVSQGHLGVAYGQAGKLALHYATAWTSDDLIAGGQLPDGRITVYGADVSVNGGRAGRLYLGAARTQATNATKVAGAIEVLNARGGPELMANYLGPASNGTGTLTTFGAQYDLSIARAVFGNWYTGVSPDVLISLFGIGTSVTSRDPAYDGVFKLKMGAEVTYLTVSWFGVSARADHVRLDGDDTRKAFTIYSGRVLFHTGWRSRDEIALQYSHFEYGSEVYVKAGSPPVEDPLLNPDRDVFSLTGTFWW